MPVASCLVRWAAFLLAASYISGMIRVIVHKRLADAEGDFYKQEFDHVLAVVYF